MWKASLLLEKIADEEKIEVGDEEIDREVEALGCSRNSRRNRSASG